MESQVKNDTFHAGICMAGAVSAGAYTAGVMDYLFEVLEHWEKAKKLQAAGKLTGIPKHNFVIEALGGASAGGMTAAITSAALQGNFDPIKQSDAANDAVTQKNPLYNSWVNLIEDDNNDMMSYMLDTSDIESDAETNVCKEVRAGFNSSFIKKIASSVLDVRVENIYDRPYLADDLDFFTTITNLRGFNYMISFDTASGIREYYMKMHRDYAFFKLSEKPYGQDGRIPINYKASTGNAENDQNIEILKAAAMSTGAFPVGLESRTLSRQREYIEDSKYLNLRLAGQDDNRVKYHFLPEGAFVSLNVDGGVINNEPFEVTQQLLDDRRRKAMSAADAENYTPKTSAAEFDSLVLMIDPFPSEETPEPTVFVPQQAWKKVVPSVLSAMIGQLRLKDEQVKRAYLDDDYTRFLVMPVRSINGENQTYTIACGSLGGFGGFFSKAFRKHDFYLGRRNCQRFLQAYLTVPEEAKNPILEYGFEGITDFRYTVNKDDKSTTYVPLIPDLRVVEDAAPGTYKYVIPPVEAEYPYPQISLTYLLGLKDKIEKRIQCILNNVQNAAELQAAGPKWESTIVPRIRKKSWFGRLFSNVVTNNLTKGYLSLGKTFGKGAAADMAIDTIIKDMEQRGLINDDYK
ncbi:patatin-like phospholipase family protein [Mucilaginibacter sabulilitoris]|uniref:Patatin-like phospholipase family protein n=1 Tax=Mucilaginibacter sabulilitoris TaxID=1173583 RepID=A0ABZ0TPP3_9SPHI|nr:patatin-like phospholipase family protein [Mucilaginibacter sabulilitoris]WPU94872.1 patatin-like phospholipase family protein [Mucilaginibacter sabulilitoris]